MIYIDPELIGTSLALGVVFGTVASLVNLMLVAVFSLIRHAAERK